MDDVTIRYAIDTVFDLYQRFSELERRFCDIERDFVGRPEVLYEIERLKNEWAHEAFSNLSALFQRHFEDGNAEISEDELFAALNGIYAREQG